MNTEHERLTWEEFGDAARELAPLVRAGGFGETLRLVAETIRPHAAELRAAVLYEKPRSVVRCDYVWRRTDRWIDFPWSTLPPVTP